MSERIISSGLGGNKELLLSHPVGKSEPLLVTEAFNVGAPQLRTDWRINSATLQFASQQSSSTVAIKEKLKFIGELEIALLYDNTPNVVTVIKVEFKENSETKNVEEKTYVLEPITPFLIPGGHSLGLSITFKKAFENFIGIKQSYLWTLINPSYTFFLDERFNAHKNLS